MLLIVFYSRSFPIGRTRPTHPFWECSKTNLKPVLKPRHVTYAGDAYVDYINVYATRDSSDIHLELYTHWSLTDEQLLYVQMHSFICRNISSP
jgi:hypothetical protein